MIRRLQTLADPAYRAFQLRLLPTVSPERILGVRLPVRVHHKTIQKAVKSRRVCDTHKDHLRSLRIRGR